MPAKKGEQTRVRPLQKQSHRVIAQPQKRGVKSYFTGSRLVFLTGYCDEYVSLRGKSRRQFWTKVFCGWWERYPWCLQDHDEPPTDNPMRMEELAYFGEADKDAKAVVEAKLREVSLSA